METNPFDGDLLNKLQNHMEEILERTPGPHYAAFDADGTLWNEDMGEKFFQYQIDHCQLPVLKNKNPWDYYLTTRKKDPIKAYLWLAQINAGQPFFKVKNWAKEASEKKETEIFESQKKWVAWLKERNVEVFIVTASVQWAVEPVAHRVGIDPDHVLGIKTQVDSQGLVTDKQEGYITWREGKARALLNKTRGVSPVFCCGNTYGDIALIETSTGCKLCIQTQTEKNALYEEEEKLKLHAEKKKWNIHHFFKYK